MRAPHTAHPSKLYGERLKRSLSMLLESCPAVCRAVRVVGTDIVEGSWAMRARRAWRFSTRRARIPESPLAVISVSSRSGPVAEEI